MSGTEAAMPDTDRRDDTERRIDSLFDDLAGAGLEHDQPHAQRMWAELQALLPSPRQPSD